MFDIINSTINKNLKGRTALKKEPIRHHYIPQFILRNFCFDDNGNTLYKDVKSKKESDKQIRDIFMEKNLYRDSINYDNPVQIEDDFACFENEVAPIIKEKFLASEEFVLTRLENEKLKLFFALMSFRSKSTQELFKKELSKESKKLYVNWQHNKNFEDFWKRNLGKLAKCRSLEEVINNIEIDEPIKVFLTRDTFGFFGKYFCVVEPKDIGEFVLSDCYPVVFRGVIDSFEMEIFDVYTISPKRAILFANVGCQGTPSDVLQLRPLVLNEPFVKDNNLMLFRVKKLYLEEVEMINNMVIKNAKEGFIHKRETRLVD